MMISRTMSFANKSLLKNKKFPLGGRYKEHVKNNRHYRTYSNQGSFWRVQQILKSEYNKHGVWKYFFLAAPVMAAVVLGAEEVENEKILEPNTGFHVDKYIWNNEQELIGTSARKVTIFKFLTYALCVYVDRSKLESLQQVLEKQAKENRETLLSKVIEDPQQITLTIVPYRKIDNQHFTRSLTEGVQPILKEMYMQKDQDQDKAKRFVSECNKQFIACFQKPQFPPGVRVDFKVVKEKSGYALEIYSDGKLESKLENDDFTRAFVEMFLGKKARTQNMKVDIENALESRMKMN